ncbi:hypothetical protein ACQPZJ_25305 [Actinoplanes sp. CA-054009]
MASEVHELLALLSMERDFHRRWEIRRDIERAPYAATVLRHIRRHGPGRLRAAALDALMHHEGESGVDPTDVAAVSVDVGWKHPHDALIQGTPVLAAVPGAGPVTLPPGRYEI